MAQRLARARRKIALAGIPFRLPPDDELADRTAAVRRVVYLVFSEGYAATGTDSVVRPDLSTEAIRLGRLLVALLPGDAETMALLALMLLHDARRPARVGVVGELVPLEEQDRSSWDGRQIAEGLGLVEAALVTGPVGPYQVQAAVAALHAQATDATDTDWPQILGLYRLLETLAPGPVVTLNRLVALAMVEGAAAALVELDRLSAAGLLSPLPEHRVPAVRAHLLDRAGRHGPGPARRRPPGAPVRRAAPRCPAGSRCAAAAPDAPTSCRGRPPRSLPLPRPGRSPRPTSGGDPRRRSRAGRNSSDRRTGCAASGRSGRATR